MRKWCTLIFLLWTIANDPSPVVGSGRGDDTSVNATVTLSEHFPDSGSGSSNGGREKENGGLRKSSSAKSEFVIVKSSLGGEEAFSRVRRIRRSASTEFLKVKLSSGSFVYRPTPTGSSNDSSKELTRVARAYPDSIKKSKGKGGYGGYKSKGYTYTTPAPVARQTSEQNDADSFTPPPPVGVEPQASYRTTTTTEDPVDVRDNIPGEPGKDYAALASVPKTTFTCEGRSPGFYADLEAGCQVFHRCTDDPWYTGQVRVIMDSFLCPNGSLFNQQIFACDWWGNTDCKGSEDFYELNQQIGQLEETDAGTVQYVKFTGIRVPPAPGTKKIAPGIVPKRERKPLADRYKNKKPKGGDKRGSGGGGNGGDGGRPLEVDEDEDDRIIDEFIEGDDEDFRPLSSQIIAEEDDREGSSQTVREVKVPTNKRSKSKKSSKKATTTTTTPPPESSEESSEETQEPSAANNNPNPFLVNRDRGEIGEAATPSGELIPPDFIGDPVDKASEEDRTRETSTRSPGSTRQDYRDEYLPPKESRGYSYPKPDTAYGTPNKPQDTYGLPNSGQYLSGTSPSTNQYLPPTQAPFAGDRNYLPPQQGLQTYSPEPDSYYRKPSSGYGQPNQEYGTPNKDSYLPPNKQSNEYLPPSKEYGGPIKDSYAPPAQQSSLEYGQPSNNYPPPSSNYQKPSSSYGQPTQEYGTPNKDSYLPPNKQSNGYLPPSKEYGGPIKDSYAPPAQQPSQEYGQPSNNYAPPSNNYLSPPSSTYSAPSGPSNQHQQYNILPKTEYSTLPEPSYAYGTPQQGGYTYFPSQTTTTVTEHWPAKFQYEAPVFSLYNAGSAEISGSYGTTTGGSAPARPADTYNAPAPAVNYGTPQNGYSTLPTGLYSAPPGPSDTYGTPNQRPSDTYGTPNQRPSDTYGTPNQRPSDTYGTPNQRPSDTYGTPNKRPSDTYGTPNQRPSDTYGTPNQRPSDTYGTPNQRPSDTYGTPNQRPSDTYGTPNQRPSDTYGTPNQRPSDTYGTPNQRPSDTYGTPNQRPSGTYGTPNQRPSDTYGTPNNQYGPPRNDYGLPNKPQNPSTEYLPPGPPQGPSENYGLPQQNYAAPPSTGYSTLPDHVLKDTYSPPPPPTAPTGYSTIPDQTPPPPVYDNRGSGPSGGSGLYAIEPPNIDILSVPLVSYSHVVNPILEFPPFKKR